LGSDLKRDLGGGSKPYVLLILVSRGKKTCTARGVERILPSAWFVPNPQKSGSRKKSERGVNKQGACPGYSRSRKAKKPRGAQGRRLTMGRARLEEGKAGPPTSQPSVGRAKSEENAGFGGKKTWRLLVGGFPRRARVKGLRQPMGLNENWGVCGGGILQRKIKASNLKPGQ